MKHTRERAAAAGLRVAELAPLPDIDRPADLAHLPAHWLRADAPGAHGATTPSNGVRR